VHEREKMTMKAQWKRDLTMKKRRILRTIAALLLSAGATASAQDSVDVTFRFQAGVTYAGVTVPGEFNGWNNTAWPMTNAGGNLWVRTQRLRIGGNPTPPANGVPGAWQYKFFPAGTTGAWPNDPLNHHQNAADNSNTFLYTKDPTIYHLVPNQRTVQGTLGTATPTISAFLFPKVGAEIDTGTISITIDSTTFTGIGAFYNRFSQQLVYPVPVPRPNGTHTVILRAGSTAGGMNADTVVFATRAGTVQITSRGNYSTVNPLRTIRGLVQDPGIASVLLVRNGTDTTVGPVTSGRFEITDTLTEGTNTFRALADSAGTTVGSDPVSFTLVVNHAPRAQITLSASGSLQISAAASTDPDPGQSAQLTFAWSEDPANPVPLGVQGSTAAQLSVPVPSASGEYYLGLVAADPDGNRDTTRSYVTVLPGGQVEIPTIASNPEWAKRARVYFLFPKAATSAGTIAAAATKLPWIRDLGFSVIWMMPVMDNAQPINNGFGPGYDIVDFYNVAPEYGTNQDFKDFVAEAHALGMKVILDVTPNHTSRQHPWCVDAHAYRQDSPYWSWYEHALIPHNDNGLGNCLDEDGFNYYCGFSKELQNFNWTDPDARAEMINVYRHWIREFGIDGYRFDVYWGPHRRYGEAIMGSPVRDALKRLKPDILLLAEDSGTGSGTELIYADTWAAGGNGGVDAAYDFKLYFDRFRNFGFTPSAVDNLHNEILNGGYYPGKNSLYMRFLESQDEDRIYYAPGGFSAPSSYYDPDPAIAFARTRPMATVLFTIPGFPMIWNGQEIGWGYGIPGAKEARNRSVINWDFQGKIHLAPHYQALAHLRGQFPAFTWHKRDTNGDGRVNAADSADIVRLGSGDGNVYAFSRPYTDQNGLAVVNFNGAPVTATVSLNAPGALKFTGGPVPGKTYWLNDLLSGTRAPIDGGALSGSISVSLAAYGSAVFTVSTTPDTLKVASPITDVGESGGLPLEFLLEQNYPNPFNPSTTIRFALPLDARVSLRVYDLLGRELALLLDGQLGAGHHAASWNGTNAAGQQVGSGVYLLRLSASGSGGEEKVMTRKMLLVR
jgi:glycosidase